MADERYLVLARKWRPQTFEDVVGQEHITRTLRNAIGSGRIHHAFLFIGSRGIGKTSTARILAKALNCLSVDGPTADPCGSCENCVSIGGGTNLDVIEIDGASNNGVDDVREIRDNVRMVPTRGRYKVYIIDEVHQLSIAAFNALLKTLEEPPAHAIFILATTEAHKIPATIVSRCQRFDFRRVSLDGLIALLRKICENEAIEASDQALYAIARAAEGGVRDSEGILDELITYCEGKIAYEDVFDVLGLVHWDVMHALCDAILGKDIAKQLTLVEEVVSGGKDLSQFVQELLRYFRNLLVCRTADPEGLLQLPAEELAAVKERAKRFSLVNLIRIVEQFAELTGSFDSQLAQRIALEALLIKLSKVGAEISVETLLEKLVALGAGGVAASTPAEEPPRQTAAKPPDPPEAGPADTAPTAPAAKRRIAVNAANVAEQWRDIVRGVSESDLNLGVWAGEAMPAAVENGVVTLEFRPACTQAFDYFERPGNRRNLEAALATVTEGLHSFRTRLREAEDSVAEDLPARENLPFYATANPEAARAALAQPRVAEIVEHFRGKIAEVRPVLE